jgi:ElaB/YqjD/DUF883 family membrane-anchored ribosome-binding protein
MATQPIDIESKKPKHSNNSIHEKTEEIAANAAEKTQEGIEKIGEAIEKLACNAEEYNKEISEYVKQKPIKSLLIAGLSGMLLGMFLKK